MKHKTWKERIAAHRDETRVEPLNRFRAKFGRGTVAIPSVAEVEAIMRSVPRGQVITIEAIRAAIAQRHGATMGCPIVTGINIWLVAMAAHEQVQAGKKKITPYWRTLRAKGELNPKFPLKRSQLKKILESEGLKVTVRGKRYRVADYEKVLFQPGPVAGKAD